MWFRTFVEPVGNAVAHHAGHRGVRYPVASVRSGTLPVVDVVILDHDEAVASGRPFRQEQVGMLFRFRHRTQREIVAVNNLRRGSYAAIKSEGERVKNEKIVIASVSCCPD